MVSMTASALQWRRENGEYLAEGFRIIPGGGTNRSKAAKRSGWYLFEQREGKWAQTGFRRNTIAAAKQTAESILSDRARAAIELRRAEIRVKLVKCILRDAKAYGPYVASFGSWWDWAEAKVGCTAAEVRAARKLERADELFDMLESLECGHNEGAEGFQILEKLLSEWHGEPLRVVPAPKLAFFDEMFDCMRRYSAGMGWQQLSPMVRALLAKIRKTVDA